MMEKVFPSSSKIGLFLKAVDRNIDSFFLIIKQSEIFVLFSKFGTFWNASENS